MHCTQADCIGCFGAECYVVGQNGQCYTLLGSYCGDCHECYEDNTPTKIRPRQKGQCTGNCTSCHGQCINIMGQTFPCDGNCSCNSYSSIISNTCNGQNLSCDENCSCNSYDNIISDTCNMAGGMLYGGGGMNNNVRSRRTSSQRSQRRTRTGGRNPMRRTRTKPGPIPAQCIGTSFEPIEFDDGTGYYNSTHDCSILSTPPHTNQSWCIEMPGCTWISGDIR